MGDQGGLGYGGPVPRVGIPGDGFCGLEKCNFADSALPCRRPTLDMSSKAGGKRPGTITSEPSNHAMVSEVPPERPGGRVGARSRSARQAAAETGCRGPPRGLSGSSPPLQASRSSRKGIAFGKRSNSMKRNPNAAVTKSGWLYKQVPESSPRRVSRPPRSRAIPFPPACGSTPSPGGCCSHCPSLAGQLGGKAVEQALVRAGGSLPLLLQRYGSACPLRLPPAPCPPPPVGPSGHQLGASMQTQAVSRLGVDFASVGKGGLEVTARWGAVAVHSTPLCGCLAHQGPEGLMQAPSPASLAARWAQPWQRQPRAGMNN